MQTEMNVSAKTGLTVRDLVTTGVFTALFLVFFMIGGAFTAPNPIATFFMPAACALLTGPVFLLLIARVPKHGPLIILGTILGILLFVTGMYWLMAVLYVVFGIAADFIVGIGKFHNKALNIVAFCLFSLSPMGSYLMLWINPTAYIGYLVAGGAEQAYMDTMVATGQPWMIFVIILSTLVCALISCFVGQRLLRKQFEKADATANSAE